MTYETWIGIEIVGIRRGLRFRMRYHVEIVEGTQAAIIDCLSVHYEDKQLPGDGVLKVLGHRQVKELQKEMISYWNQQMVA
jgi:hypothetical protein